MIMTRISVSLLFTLFVVPSFLLRARLSYGSSIAKKAFNTRESALFGSYPSKLKNTVFTVSLPTVKKSDPKSLQKGCKQSCVNRRILQFLKSEKMDEKDELLSRATIDFVSGFKSIGSRTKRSAVSSNRRRTRPSRRGCNTQQRSPDRDGDVQCLFRRNDGCDITLVSTNRTEDWRKRGSLQFDTSILAYADSSKRLKKAFLEVFFGVTSGYKHSKIRVFVYQQYNKTKRVFGYKDLTVTGCHLNIKGNSLYHSKKRVAKLRFQITNLSRQANSHVGNVTEVGDPVELASWRPLPNLKVSALCFISGRKNMPCKRRVTILQHPQLVLRTFNIRHGDDLR